MDKQTEEKHVSCVTVFVCGTTGFIIEYVIVKGKSGYTYIIHTN